MGADRRHKAFLSFVKKLLDIPAGMSKEDLFLFQNIARREFPALQFLIDEYIRLAERSDSEVSLPKVAAGGRSEAKAGAKMHLFDLLRDKRVFQSNAELSDFASRTLPDIRGHRFDKMSRGDIAARIIEFLETLDKATRSRLETSMREALTPSNQKKTDRSSFFSQWEKIIRGIEL